MLVLFGVAGLALLTIWLFRRSCRLPLPPSLRYSAHGNEAPWKFYAAESTNLGSIFTIQNVGRPVVVINTVDVALDLLERRSHFSCRPRWPMAELLGRQKNVGFQYYGERLKRCRKLLHGAIGQSALSTTWSTFLDSQSLALLCRFRDSSEEPYVVISRCVEELLMRFTYGQEPNPEYRKLANEVMHETSIALQPGRWMVNLVPTLMYVPSWLPGAGFKRWASSARENFFKLTREPFLEVKRSLAQNSATAESFVKHALQTCPGAPDDEDIIVSVAGSLYSAGTDTINAVILTLFLLLIRHPEVQERVYREISCVVGLDRLPDLSDRDSLPYLDSVLQESMRFNPPVPLVAHSNWKEESYGGHRIPQKTWVMANVWAMLHDEVEYPLASEFRPERFLSKVGYAPPRDPRSLIYGFGRRLCPGLHFANAYIFLVAARTLACYKLLPQDNRLPPPDFVTGLISSPQRFGFILRPREECSSLLANIGP